MKTHCRNGHELTPDNILIWADGFTRCRACRARTRKRNYKPRPSEFVPVASLQTAFKESSVTATQVARSLGWERRDRGRMEPDQSRVMRALGLRQYKLGSGRGHALKRRVRYDTALALVKAMGLDPWEVGL